MPIPRFSYLIILILLAACSQKEVVNEADILIKGGKVIDGTGEEGLVTDVLIVGDNIVHVGNSDSWSADSVVDASGMVVTPGFIDPHAHGNPLANNDFRNFIAQGVTTIILGQDGASPGGGDITGWYEGVDSLKLQINVGALVGHGSIRRLAGVKDDEAPGEKMEIMEQLLSVALSDGSFGMSTGLEYIPGFYAEEQELHQLARVVGDHQGIIISHMRNEDDDKVEESLNELLAQSEFCRVQASHLKVVFGKGKDRAEEILNIIDSAKNIGREVYADVYPYTASYTGIGIVFPEWAKRPFDYKEVKRTRRQELLTWVKEKVISRNGPEATLFGSGDWKGMTLKDIADSLNKPFEEFLVDDIGPEGASAAYFVMDKELQDHLLKGDGVMVCSDGSPTMWHPRGYGSFSRFIEDHIVSAELVDLETGIYKMSGLPAEALEIKDRGLIKPGYYADILVFEPGKIKTIASFEEPHQLSEGFALVIVNGKVVKSGEDFPQVTPGVVIRKSTQ